MDTDELDRRFQKLQETLEWMVVEGEALLAQLQSPGVLDAKTIRQTAVLRRLARAVSDRQGWGG
jgi:hypothetical protein